MSIEGLLLLSTLFSLTRCDFLISLLKLSTSFFPGHIHQTALPVHLISFGLTQDPANYIPLCFSLLASQSTVPIHYFSQFIEIMVLLGFFTTDISLFLPLFLILFLSFYRQSTSLKNESKNEYKQRIIEENLLYEHELEALVSNPNSKKSHMRRSSTILAKLKRLKHKQAPYSLTENSHGDESPSSELSFSQSRKSSFNDSQGETPNSNSSNFDQILPGISNEEIKEIINTLISQEYLVWNPDKCAENEIDVIAIALEAKSVFTQSIENLPGSSHRTLKIKQKLKKRDSIRSMIEVSEPLTEVLESIGDWDFDCFELIQITRDPAFEVGLYIFNILGISDRFNIENVTLRKFLTAVEHGYNKNNFYHNSIHAADVTASTLFLIQKGLSRCGNLIDLDAFALVVAALCHDIGHLGLNNAFLVATGHELAVKYNDQSCLENMHANKTFSIISSEGARITAALNKADYQRFRKSVVCAILSTDLQMHFNKLNEFIANLDKRMDISDDKFRMLAIQICLKCADIGHGAKRLDIHMNWTRLITKEFFHQGDKERECGIPVTPLCDRSTCVISNSQTGFLQVLVEPLFKRWEEFIEMHNEEDEDLEIKVCTRNICENLDYWKAETERFHKGETEFILDDDSPPLI